jgi:hypothetical protein
MFNLTPQSIDLWLKISNGALILCAAIVTLATGSSIWLTGIKEHTTNERIAANEAATARAGAESEKAKEAAAIANQAAAVADQRAAQSNERAARLEKDAAEVRERAALTEQRLLDERRLTANERWRLEFLERAVLPRSLTQAQIDALIPKLVNLGPINVALLQAPEPQIYGAQLIQLFQAANILGRVISLPPDSRQMGVVVYAADARGRQIAEVLHEQRIVGGMIGGGIRPIGLEAIPTDQNTLIVGDNAAGFGGRDGQPGEGLDQYGEPVPAPR